MTETRRAVESGNHEENSDVSNSRGSRDRAICGGMLIFKDFVIFSSNVESLMDAVSINFLCLVRGMRAPKKAARSVMLWTSIPAVPLGTHNELVILHEPSMQVEKGHSKQNRTTYPLPLSPPVVA